MRNTVNPEMIDAENPEWTDEMFAKAKRGTAAAALRGRPPLEQPKVAVTLRYDAEIIDAFKATGKGWQTRMNEALKDWLKDHAPV